MVSDIFSAILDELLCRHKCWWNNGSTTTLQGQMNSRNRPLLQSLSEEGEIGWESHSHGFSDGPGIVHMDYLKKTINWVFIEPLQPKNLEKNLLIRPKIKCFSIKTRWRKLAELIWNCLCVHCICQMKIWLAKQNSRRVMWPLPKQTDISKAYRKLLVPPWTNLISSIWNEIMLRNYNE